MGSGLDLTEESLVAYSRRELCPEDFHCHIAVVLEVTGEIHRGHAARADLFLDGIAVGKGGFESVEKVRHCVLAPVATVLEYGFGPQTARYGEDEPTSRINIRPSL